MVEQSQKYLEELNDAQRAAVTHGEGPSLVIAGPGAGKTRVLTYRMAHLIFNGVQPFSILALTFTNKSAREMKERIEEVVGGDARNIWAGTFHSIFARILRYEADLLGFPKDFTIYDSADSKSLVKRITKELRLDDKKYHPSAVASRISRMKSALIPPERYLVNQELLTEDRLAKRPHFQEVYKQYVARCKRSGVMDFDDLLVNMFVLLEKNPGGQVLKKYRDKFQYLLVDEFQDTNTLQYAILKKLCLYEGSKMNMCAVGDDAQSIYSFRGATIRNILDFERDFPGIKIYKLEQNYRSTQHIVGAANDVIGKNRDQIKKELWTNHDEGDRINLVRNLTDKEEGNFVTTKIVEQKNRYHLTNSEIAILYRTNAQSRIFEETLRRQNLPYKVFGGQSFYQRKEIKDMLGYMRLVVNENDDEALLRVINFPKRGIGKTTIDRLTALASQNGMSIWEVLQNLEGKNRALGKINSFRDLIKEFKSKAESLNAFEIAHLVAHKSGLINHFKMDGTPEGAGRFENVVELLDGIQEFVNNDEVIDEAVMPDKSLAGYLQNIALITDFDQSEDVNSDDYITLMSVHSAKGLEYDSIFVVGMEEELFPSFMAMGSSEEIEEERRLFYVAITRARKFLTITYSDSRFRYGKLKYMDPSRFISDIAANRFSELTSIPNSRNVSTPTRGTLHGSFKSTSAPKISTPIPENFTPSDASEIIGGAEILHMRFGKGKVLQVEGDGDKKIATVFFEQIGQKRIMLKFAKLQVL